MVQGQKTHKFDIQRSYLEKTGKSYKSISKSLSSIRKEKSKNISETLKKSL